jgi:hypothetical protein
MYGGSLSRNSVQEWTSCDISLKFKPLEAILQGDVKDIRRFLPLFENLFLELRQSTDKNLISTRRSG